MSLIEESTRACQQLSGKLTFQAKTQTSVSSPLDSASSSLILSPFSSNAMTLDPDSLRFSCDPFRSQGVSGPPSSHTWRVSKPRPKCVDWCSCNCHARRSFRSPWVLKTIFGQFFVEYTANGSECNDHGCRHLPSSSLYMTYHLPHYLMTRYIVIAMQFISPDGPKVSLRVPKVMDWPHALFKYANAGDVEAIQALFSNGEASPYDVNPRGTSALTYAAAHSHPRVGKLLMDNGADPELVDSLGKKPVELFWERAFSGQFNNEDCRIVASMFEASDFFEHQQFTVIHKIILRLVDKDLEAELKISAAFVNNVDAQGRTALCWATIRDDSTAVETLLKFRANPNIPDHEGNTCLHFTRSIVVCRLLLHYPTDW